jgi:hypothetical protein
MAASGTCYLSISQTTKRYIFTSVFFVSASGVPVKLLHEGEGHVVTVELKNGEIYRGLLSEAEDTMNCQMKEGFFLFFFGFLHFLIQIPCLY